MKLEIDKLRFYLTYCAVLTEFIMVHELLDFNYMSLRHEVDI